MNLFISMLAIFTIYGAGVAFLVRREIKRQEKIEKKIIRGRTKAASAVKAWMEK